MKQETTNIIVIFFAGSCFVMLSMLTWGASPLQKLVEKVQYKETIKVKMKLCNEMRAMLPVYQDWTRLLFINGCLWFSRESLFITFPEKKDAIRQQWADQEGKEFELMNNTCMMAAAAQQEENNIRDEVASPLYYDKLDCPAIYDEADKLRIENAQ